MIALNPAWPRPDQVLDRYERLLEATRLAESVLRDAPERIGIDSPFFGMPLTEALEELRREIDAQGAMMLAASFEATLRVDLLERRRAKRKDPASRALRKLKLPAKHYQLRIDTIVDKWKTITGKRQVFANLLQVFKYRHWLAHGRYWNQKSGLASLDPIEARRCWHEALAVLPPSFPMESTESTK